MSDETKPADERVAPFDSLPSGIDIARYFWHETERSNPGCDGIDLYRDGSDYCYLWVEAMVDLDYYEAYLLDVRTHTNVPPGEIGETRDFLFIFAGTQDRFDVEWHEHPIAFSAPAEEHRDRFRAGMLWLTDRIEKALEDIDSDDRQRSFRSGASDD